MDQELRFHAHGGQIAKRGLRAVMALKRLRALTPQTTRRLFQATVIPRIDYASFVWSPRANSKTRKLLDATQRIDAQAIVGVFRTVALYIAQAEANIEPLQQRWQRQSGQTWTQWHTLPPSHPFWKTRRRLDLRSRRYKSPSVLCEAAAGTPPGLVAITVSSGEFVVTLKVTNPSKLRRRPPVIPWLTSSLADTRQVPR